MPSTTTEENLNFPVTPDILATTKTQRLQYFERQIADTLISIQVYDALITTYNNNEDIQQRELEYLRLDRYVLSYNAVNGEA